MFGFIQGGDSVGDSISGRNAVCWLGIGGALAEPQRASAGVTFDFNADKCGGRIVRKFYGLLELTTLGRFSEREPAQLQLTYHRAGSSQIIFPPRKNNSAKLTEARAETVTPASPAGCWKTGP